MVDIVGKAAGDMSACFRFTLLIRVRTCLSPTCSGHLGLAGWAAPVGWVTCVSPTCSGRLGLAGGAAPVGWDAGR